jgi:uncharacterized protein YjeT (DUF2065 family)
VELLQGLVTYFAILINVFVLVAPIAFGGYFFLFAKRVSLDMLRYRQRVWKWGFSQVELKMGEWFVRIAGLGMLLIGSIIAWQVLFE